MSTQNVLTKHLRHYWAIMRIYKNKYQQHKLYKKLSLYIQKHQILCLLTSISILICTLCFIYIEPKLEQQKLLHAEFTSLEEKKKNIEKTKHLEIKIAALEQKLFSKTDMLKFASTWIPLTAKKEGVTIKKSNYTEPKVSNDALKQDINLNLECDFKAFLNFIHKIENCPKYVSIKRLELKKKQSGQGLTALLSLTSYGLHEKIN